MTALGFRTPAKHRCSPITSAVTRTSWPRSRRRCGSLFGEPAGTVTAQQAAWGVEYLAQRRAKHAQRPVRASSRPSGTLMITSSTSMCGRRRKTANDAFSRDDRYHRLKPLTPTPGLRDGRKSLWGVKQGYHFFTENCPVRRVSVPKCRQQSGFSCPERTESADFRGSRG